jgi:pyrroline-5-carboxylate reductase
MTNLAVEIGLGTSALFANAEVTQEQKSRMCRYARSVS